MMNKHISKIWYDIDKLANEYKIIYTDGFQLWRAESDGKFVSFYDEVEEFLRVRKNDKVITDYSLVKEVIIDNSLFYCGVVSVAWVEDSVLEQYNFVWIEEVD